MTSDALIEELRRFIKEQYRFVSLPGLFSPAQNAVGGNDDGNAASGNDDGGNAVGGNAASGLPGKSKGVIPGKKLDEVSRLLSAFVREKHRPDFSHTLDSLRIEKGLKPQELYKAAWVDKRVYSKIMAPEARRPSKDTALQFAFALKLDEADFGELLQSAGFALSDSSMRDLVFRFCVERGIFDLHDVNALLLAAEQKLLCTEPAEDRSGGEQ